MVYGEDELFQQHWNRSGTEITLIGYLFEQVSEQQLEHVQLLAQLWCAPKQGCDFIKTAGLLVRSLLFALSLYFFSAQNKKKKSITFKT